MFWYGLVGVIVIITVLILGGMSLLSFLIEFFKYTS